MKLVAWNVVNPFHEMKTSSMVSVVRHNELWLALRWSVGTLNRGSNDPWQSISANTAIGGHRDWGSRSTAQTSSTSVTVCPESRFRMIDNPKHDKSVSKRHRQLAYSHLFQRPIGGARGGQSLDVRCNHQPREIR